MAVVSKHRLTRRDELQEKVDLSFAAQRWQRFDIKRRSDHSVSDRRALEVSGVYLSEALQTGDHYVVGAEEFADYRVQLLPWSERETRLAAYCASLGIPEGGADFAATLKVELTTFSAEAEAGFPANSELDIDKAGTPRDCRVGNSTSRARHGGWPSGGWRCYQIMLFIGDVYYLSRQC